MGVSQELHSIRSKDYLLIVYPVDQHWQYSVSITGHFDDSRTGAIIITKSEEEIPVALNAVYFIDREKIVFSKTIAELGIEPSNVMSKEVMRPVLEQMIRENVVPQEPQKEQ
jgi:hypothetical protein